MKMSQLVRMLQDFWPDNSRTLSAYYRNPGRIIQESCPRVTGTLSGCYKNNHIISDISSILPPAQQKTVLHRPF